MRSTSAQKKIDRFKKWINKRNELSLEQKSKMIRDLEELLDEHNRQHYVIKAVITEARRCHNQGVGPISGFIFKILGI